MSHSKDDKERISLDRRRFLRVGGLGAAAPHRTIGTSTRYRRRNPR